MRALFAVAYPRRRTTFSTATTTAAALAAALVATSSMVEPVRSFSAKRTTPPPRRAPTMRTGLETNGKAADADGNGNNGSGSFSFGVIADVQWADTPDGYNYAKTVKRCYRGALTTLGNAVDWWSDLPEPPSFIAQLGDLIDGKNNAEQLDTTDAALEAALDHLNRLPCPSVHLVGNHELYNFDRKALAEASWLQHGDKEYYGFSPAEGWRMVVVDPYQLALIGHAEDDPRRIQAVELMARENPNVDADGKAGNWFEGMEDAGYRRRFVPYNGGFGAEQLAWLREELADASTKGERVIVLSHVILHPEACGGFTMAWDYEEALDAVRSEEAGGCVAAVLSGHDHNGNYHRDEFGVHHCTFVSPLNKGEDGSAFGLVSVQADRLEIRGPVVDDLLPDVEGRPSPRTEDSSSSYGPCEVISLPLEHVVAPSYSEQGATKDEVNTMPTTQPGVVEIAA